MGACASRYESQLVYKSLCVGLMLRSSVVFFGGSLNLVHKHVITLLPTIEYLQEQENAMGCAGGGCR
jgi:hypothetical protein